MKYLQLFILLIFVSFSTADMYIHAVEKVDLGTLIVSYYVDGQPDRLSRIRFLLISENNENLYPKGSAYVEDRESTSRIVAIENLPIGIYKIQFLIPNADNLFEEISERTITISKNSVSHVNQNIRLKETSPSVLIPAGKSILGDPGVGEKINELSAKIVILNSFSISIYEVSNSQYARWLNQALKAGKIVYVGEGKNKGQVLDKQQNLLFKSTINDSYSQITVQQEGTSPYSFIPIKGKEVFPVVDVSWYGAMKYCEDNHCRLPTEAEWEKAAGMAQSGLNGEMKKFTYGFGQNEINPSWANYKNNSDSAQKFSVATTPVGFYNGINFIPNASIDGSTVEQVTHLAVSPYGLFDMSGNVWEWVGDWFDANYYKNMSEDNPKGPSEGTKKVAKGGCYDSFSDGVRVTERIGLSPNHADLYTGFRTVVDQ